MLYYKTIKNPNVSEWVVFIHGLCGNSAMWSNQIFSFKEKYNLLLLDLPSHGNSENAIIENHVQTMKDVADLVIDILDENSISKAHFAGVSIGTLVVGKIYELYPERVSSIVFCGAVVSMNIFENIMCDILKFSSKLLNPRTMANIWVDYILDKGERKGIREHFIEQSKKISKHDTMKWIEMSVKEHALLTKLDYENLNVLFIMGEKDKLFLTPVKKLKERFSNINLSVIENGGHICNAQKYKEFNKLSLDFFALT